MIILGLALLLIGLLVPAVHFLFVIGIILLVIGLVLAFAGGAGHSFAGRRYWY